MEIIVHYPEDKRGKNALKKAVAEVHSEYIYSSLERLNCPQEKKKMLIESTERLLTRKK